MTKEIEVLIEGKVDYLEVDFTAHVSGENDSFDHEPRNVREKLHPVINGEIEWNKKPFTKEQNKAIADYLAVAENWKIIVNEISNEAMADCEY